MNTTMFIEYIPATDRARVMSLITRVPGKWDARWGSVVRPFVCACASARGKITYVRDNGHSVRIRHVERDDIPS